MGYVDGDTGRAARPRGIIGLHQIPNAISIARVAVILLAMERIVALYRQTGDWPVLWLSVATAAALTDRLDGFLAKRYGWASKLGAYLDHTSDKVVTAAMYVFLAQLIAFPFWALGALLFRELFVTGLRTTGNAVQVEVRTSQAGRLKTFVQQLGALVLVVDWGATSAIAGHSVMQWIVWAGVGGFLIVVLASRTIRSGLRRVYSVRLSEENVSVSDYYVVLIGAVIVLAPIRHFGPVGIVYATVATGATYLWNFFVVVHHKGAQASRQAWWLTGANVLLSGVVAAAACWALHLWPMSLWVVRSVTGGLALLWTVALVVNYRTSP
ncbi:MAG: CDP-alcohol phosphatidyltransferase family protein [Deltaproteobacteria bacterium]|nr:CDP-alcohol phosphatidyltransferase family protein [Deltaproteobacteria bacterium]